MMRTPTDGERGARWLRATLLGAGWWAGTGCATVRATMNGYVTGPDGITRPQQRLRQAFIEGDFATALAWHEDDALLQALTAGAAAYYAQQFGRSAAVLDTAALLADDRVTASLSRDGLALVTNDMARPYQPRRTERLFIPYYAMLSYVRLGAWSDAAVEARRLVGLLAQLDEDRDPGERAVHGAMRHLAGAVFEAAGERNDAQVAYRAAHATDATMPATIDRGTIADDGELLLVVERGFVAHRATETIDIQLDDDERDSLQQRDPAGRQRAAVDIAGRVGDAPTRQSRSAASLATSLGLPTYASAGRHRRRDEDDDDYHLTIAFPSLRRWVRPWGGEVGAAVDGVAVEGMAVSAVVDDASAADARRERLALASRAVARAAAKYVVTKAIRDGKGETAGQLANVGASLLERADVRSWHLLPQQITLVRLRVPAGMRAVQLTLGDGSVVRVVDAGSVTVRAGGLTIVPMRLWRDPPPAPAPVQAVLAVSADSACATVFCP